MRALIQHFEQIYIHSSVMMSEVAQRVRELFPEEKIQIVDSDPMPEVAGDLSAREFDRSKRRLYLTSFKGQFFKRCPGSRPGLACCNYFVLNWGFQCDMNCSYCYLQSFINSPLLTVYTNLDDALAELAQMGSAGLKDHALRVGTGETVDSLSLDPVTLYSHRLIRFFRDYPKWTLEFKTKSASVDQFLKVPHGGNVIVSWSINPQNVITREEHGTASLEARLDAATRALGCGFPVAFHIDPMIWHPEWKESYGGLVDEISAQFQPHQVPYLSVGALRFQPEQRAIMRERFGMNSYVTRAEVFPSSDGKLRYDAHLRQEMFQFVLDRFRAKSPQWRVFLCMETPETWLQSAGGSPFRNAGLSDLFKRPTAPALREEC